MAFGRSPGPNLTFGAIGTAYSMVLETPSNTHTVQVIDSCLPGIITPRVVRIVRGIPKVRCKMRHRVGRALEHGYHGPMGAADEPPNTAIEKSSALVLDSPIESTGTFTRATRARFTGSGCG